MNEFVIEVNKLTKNYGKKIAVDKIPFSQKKGEIFGLIGPNGAGKTTTIKILTTLVKPDEEEVYIDSFNLFKEPWFPPHQEECKEGL